MRVVMIYPDNTVSDPLDINTIPLPLPDGVALRDVTDEVLPADPIYDPVAQLVVSAAEAEAVPQQPPTVM